MNDMHQLPTFSSIILFADNTTLFSARNTHFLRCSLEHDTSLLMDWYQANKLSLNIDKTVLLKFWPGKHDFNIKVGGTLIHSTPSMKFLGVVINDCLTWKYHVNTLYCKMNSNRILLMNAKNLLPEPCLLQIYCAHVHSHVTYGISVWGKMCPKSLQNSLYRLQKECVQIINKRDCNKDVAFRCLKVIRLPDLITLHQQKLSYMVSHKLLPKPLLDIFNKTGGKKSPHYPTRNKSVPNIQIHQNVAFNSSFLCKGTMTCNQLLFDIKQEKSLNSFLSKVKQTYVY